MISKSEKQALVAKYGENDKDSGNVKVQIAILTAEIEKLKGHFEINKKDFHSKRGFFQKIEDRKKLVSYLKNQDNDEYLKLIKELGIRK